MNITDIFMEQHIGDLRRLSGLVEGPEDPASIRRKIEYLSRFISDKSITDGERDNAMQLLQKLQSKIGDAPSDGGGAAQSQAPKLTDRQLRSKKIELKWKIEELDEITRKRKSGELSNVDGLIASLKDEIRDLEQLVAANAR